MAQSQKAEPVKLSQALSYIRFRTGFNFSRRQFQRWLEAGLLKVNGRSHSIRSAQIGTNYYIERESLDALIDVLKTAMQQDKPDR